MTNGLAPPLLSVPRLTTLTASLLVALSSGTGYLFSAWAPQLGAKLHISHTQINLIGLAGMAPQPVLRYQDLSGAGHSGLKYFFDAGVPQGADSISTFVFVSLVLCSCMTGIGASSGGTGATNATAKSFPDKARATATGIVISGYGLSAFVFSAIAHMLFAAGNTSAFLLLLAIGTSVPMLVGTFLVRIIPLQSPGAGERKAATSTSALPVDESRVGLLEHEDSDVEFVELDGFSEEHGDFSQKRKYGTSPNIFGAKLWKSYDFWLLFTLLSLLAGTGLMYISNVGAMSQILYAKNNPKYDEVEVAKWQTTQVSTISIMSFSGRLLIGIVSDIAKNTLGLPRSYCLILVSIGICLSQVIAANIDKITSLWLSSSILGLSYGSLFSLFPQVCIDWFGLPHFAENWGYLNLAPMVAGNIFMLFFGRNLDAHEAISHSTSATSRALSALMRRAGGLSQPGETPKCLEGKECYVAALHLTAVMTFGCILLSVVAAWRDRRKGLVVVDDVDVDEK
ncbi:hypothetical protein NP233_g3602 [Leucocoprinus birnbaumii]|uniref:MFS general substrate transporter n=1 Tax=Leucocoprinus birnbaumii TaxID=56174 RepID=A0AAD5VYV3_9AGAR|nr:hypothetical protein NP233_g3602 [Leucocoprinus birnbaumii]